MSVGLSTVIAAAAVVVLAALSLGASRVLQGQAEIPMQWGLDGKPTWSAPRLLALAFMPGLGALVLPAVAWKESGRPGVVLFAAAVLVLGHILHLVLTVRTGRG